MRELLPAMQTAGSYHELPCDETRWAAVWVWWAASSWPALKLLQIHPPQLEKPLEDAAHLFNSCLGCSLTFSDKEPAPKRNPEHLCLPFAEHRWLRSQKELNVILYASPPLTHRQGCAFCDLRPALFYCCATFRRPKPQQVLATVRAIQTLSP